MGLNDDETMGNGHGPVFYISGEESPNQIASRAMRLGVQESELLLFCETDADTIAETVVSYCEDGNYGVNNDDENQLHQRKQPSLIIIDSIQTMTCADGGSSAAGGVTQVRECVALFLRLAKSTLIPVLLIGHVTKSGGVAGPRTVEHMVDAVLYLEGDRGGGGANLRMLRANKNRFGSSDEVGVYELSPIYGGQLIPVSDPSSLLLANRLERAKDCEGCSISLALEGARSMTVEVQALVSKVAGKSSFSGRRTVDGISPSRLLLILAVLQKTCRLSLYGYDVFVNVVGGIRLNGGKGDGSSSDLAVAVSIASSLAGISIRADTAFVGEIGLLGEIRQVPSIEKRVKEARRMGFSRVVIPKQFQGQKRRHKFGRKPIPQNSNNQSVYGIETVECESLLHAINEGLVSKLPPPVRKKRKDQAELSEIGRKSDSFQIDLNEASDDSIPIIDDDDEY